MFYDNKGRDSVQDLANLKLLYQLSAFIGSKRMVTLFHSEECRFTTSEVTGLFEKLREDLLFYFRQGVNCDYLEKSGLRRKSEIPLEEALFGLSAEIEFIADFLSNELSIKVRKADRKFSVSKGVTVLNHVVKMFPRKEIRNLNTWLNAFSGPCSTFHAHYIIDVFSNLSNWLGAMDTLANRTNLPGYEVMLGSVFNKKDYLSRKDGYPLDLLVHDRIILEEKEKVLAILVNPHYPASKVVMDGNNPDPGGFIVYSM